MTDFCQVSNEYNIYKNFKKFFQNSETSVSYPIFRESRLT